jgi:hypothetical protein
VALFEDQVSVELPPDVIEVGLAVILALGLPPLAAGVPPPFCHPSRDLAPVGSACRIGSGDSVRGRRRETTIDPFRATGVALRFALTRLMVFQVSVELPPTMIVVGFALIPAASACAHAEQQSRAVTTVSQIIDASRTRTLGQSNSAVHPSRS